MIFANIREKIYKKEILKIFLQIKSLFVNSLNSKPRSCIQLQTNRITSITFHQCKRLHFSALYRSQGTDNSIIRFNSCDICDLPARSAIRSPRLSIKALQQRFHNRSFSAIVCWSESSRSRKWRARNAVAVCLRMLDDITQGVRKFKDIILEAVYCFRVS